MVKQPQGTVTLVFSDIEGSTKLLEALGTNAYRQALAEHRQIVRAACARYQGYEVGYEGDAFFYAFSSAPQAISAVSEAMTGLGPGPIAIRVGIHTGSPELDPPKYVGMDVHTAARIMSCGHGGQVVVSQTTAALLDIPLTELGEHRLKDIQEAVPLYQLGDGSFPPLKTISNTNLPRPASSFVGRDRETEEVVVLLSDGARLLTLSGPGGSGKTRLAIEAASELVPDFKAGVFWVGLATLRDPALVTETIAQTLGAKDSLAEHIGEREMLLLLDNLEQVIDAAPELGSLLEACPNLTMLVTSRELLRIRGEVEYAVPPLAEPEAVSLFCERSQLAPDDTIAELCQSLDNLPLAVELAAARTSVLTPEQILERLSQRLDLLKGGRDADPRQATLRATIEWSYELLTPEEQQLFVRLSVFAGGCTLEAAEEVAEADLDKLQSLVEKSLLRYTNERYWMLETIREYAAERLQESGEADELRQRHAELMLALVREAESGMRGSEQEHWLDRLDRERANLRAALGWVQHTEQTDLLLDLLASVPHGRYRRETRSSLEHALAASDGQRTIARAKVLRVAAIERTALGDYSEASALCEESLSIFRELDDDAEIGIALRNLGVSLSLSGRQAEARRAFEEAVVYLDAAGDRYDAAFAAGNLVGLALLEHDYASAVSLGQDAVENCRELGVPDLLAWTLANLAQAFLDGGQSELAVSPAREALETSHRIGDLEILVDCLVMLGALASRQGEPEVATRLIGTVEVAREELGTVAQPHDAARADKVERDLRRQLGEAGYEACIAEGRELTLDEAVALALEAVPAM